MLIGIPELLLMEVLATIARTTLMIQAQQVLASQEMILDLIGRTEPLFVITTTIIGLFAYVINYNARAFQKL